MTPGPRAHSKEVKFTVKFMKRDKCFKKSVRVLELFLIFFFSLPYEKNISESSAYYYTKLGWGFLKSKPGLAFDLDIFIYICFSTLNRVVCMFYFKKKKSHFHWLA